MLYNRLLAKPTLHPSLNSKLYTRSVPHATMYRLRAHGPNVQLRKTKATDLCKTTLPRATQVLVFTRTSSRIEAIPKLSAEEFAKEAFLLASLLRGLGSNISSGFLHCRTPGCNILRRSLLCGDLLRFGLLRGSLLCGDLLRFGLLRIRHLFRLRLFQSLAAVKAPSFSPPPCVCPHQFGLLRLPLCLLTALSAPSLRPLLGNGPISGGLLFGDLLSFGLLRCNFRCGLFCVRQLFCRCLLLLSRSRLFCGSLGLLGWGRILLSCSKLFCGSLGLPSRGRILVRTQEVGSDASRPKGRCRSQTIVPPLFTLTGLLFSSLFLLRLHFRSSSLPSRRSLLRLVRLRFRGSFLVLRGVHFSSFLPLGFHLCIRLPFRTSFLFPRGSHCVLLPFGPCCRGLLLPLVCLGFRGSFLLLRSNHYLLLPLGVRCRCRFLLR